MPFDSAPNPLIPALQARLYENPDGITEFGLMKQLEAHAAFADLARDTQLRLFQKHFMIMNGLYVLQTRLWHEARIRLEISPLCIRLLEEGEGLREEPGDAGLPDAADPLRAYYLDWQQLERTTAADVQRLLSGLAQRLADPTAHRKALATLELEEGASQQQIRQRYRQLAARLHPDRGGNAEEFVRLRRAYELLRSGPASA